MRAEPGDLGLTAARAEIPVAQTGIGVVAAVVVGMVAAAGRQATFPTGVVAGVEDVAMSAMAGVTSS